MVVVVLVVQGVVGGSCCWSRWLWWWYVVVEVGLVVVYGSVGVVRGTRDRVKGPGMAVEMLVWDVLVVCFSDVEWCACAVSVMY
jgi:hypothetical protein